MSLSCLCAFVTLNKDYLLTYLLIITLYPIVYRLIAGDVPIYLKFALKMTHFSRKRKYGNF